jgi:Ohr subfamily peroxiredoxin
MKTLYTAQAVVEGGRQGHGRTSDGRLDLDVSVPVEMSGAGGPGTNPEQLFAVGYAACFQSALMGVATGRKLDASDSRITSRVGIGPTGHGGFTLSVSLDLHARSSHQRKQRISWRERTSAVLTRTPHGAISR